MIGSVKRRIPIVASTQMARNSHRMAAGGRLPGASAKTASGASVSTVIRTPKHTIQNGPTMYLTENVQRDESMLERRSVARSGNAAAHADVAPNLRSMTPLRRKSWTPVFRPTIRSSVASCAQCRISCVTDCTTIVFGVTTRVCDAI